MDIGVLGIYICLFIGLYFEVFLFISFLEKRPSQKTKTLPKRYPSTTIIIPCWNKAQTLAGTVHSLLEMQYPKDKFSIVIVDDGSTDDTLAAAMQFAQNPQVNIFH